MNDALNTAEAFLDAGNLVSARRLIEEALAKDPQNVEASLLLVALEQRASDPELVLDLTARFIAQWPDVVGFRMQRLSALADAGRPDEMRSEIARLRAHFPYLPEADHYWCGVFEVRFGSAIHARHHLDQLRRHGEDSAYVPALESLIATADADFFANERIVRTYLENGRGDAATLAELSLCEFFNFKIGASRRTAAAALALDPRQSTAKSVRLLSRLVWFPPFFFAHLCLLPSGAANPDQPLPVRVFLGGLDFWLIVILLGSIVLLALWPSALTALALAALFVGWMLWTRIVNFVLRLYGRRAKQVVHVDLKDF